jgi:hypothetical protein
MSAQYKNLGLILGFSTKVCVVFSSILTHAISLTLIADMCWLKVIAIVPYHGTMISDHDTALKPGVSCGLQPIGSTAGAHCYRGL